MGRKGGGQKVTLGTKNFRFYYKRAISEIIIHGHFVCFKPWFENFYFLHFHRFRIFRELLCVYTTYNFAKKKTTECSSRIISDCIRRPICPTPALVRRNNSKLPRITTTPHDSRVTGGMRGWEGVWWALRKWQFLRRGNTFGICLVCVRCHKCVIALSPSISKATNSLPSYQYGVKWAESLVKPPTPAPPLFRNLSASLRCPNG